MSDAKTLAERELIEALQGDAAAITRLADRIYDNQQQQQPTDGRVLVSQEDFERAVVTAGNDRAAFLDAVKDFRSGYKDVCERPDTYELIKRVDERLAMEHPEWSYTKRLQVAGNRVRKLVDEEEDGDERYRSNVIEYMKASRGPRSGEAMDIEPADLTVDDYGNSIEDEFDADRATAIAEMAAARRAGHEGLGD